MLKMKMVWICSTVLALAAVSLLGCTKSEDARSPSPPPPQPAPTTSSSNTSFSSASSNAMPSTQGEFPGVTVAVQELKRGSNTLNLKITVANQSNQQFSTYYYFFEKEGHSVDGIHLIDPVGKKKYFVVRDSDGACLCSREVQAIAPGAQSVMWAKFPAPPDDVQKMTVEIPHFPPLEDVPVSR